MSGYRGEQVRRVVRTLRLLALAAPLLAASGCVWSRPQPVFLLRRGLLYPPGEPKKTERAYRPARVEIRMAGGRGCRALSGSYRDRVVGLEWALARGKVNIEMDPVASRFVGNGMPVALLDGLKQLRAVLARAAARGCFGRERIRAAFAKLSESLPLSPALSQSLLLGPYVAQRFVGIAGPVELQLTYALDRGQPARYDLGYVVRIYRMVAVQPGGRGRLRLEAVAVRDAPTGTLPPASPVRLAGAAPGFYRLFFYLRRSPADHDVALLAAASGSALAAATRAMLSRPNECRVLAVAGARCAVMPPDVGLEARLRVRVEGRWTSVPITATVGQAIAAAGVRPPAQVVRTLRVLRPYRSGYAPVLPAGARGALLDLLLSGGEQIWW